MLHREHGVQAPGIAGVELFFLCARISHIAGRKAFATRVPSGTRAHVIRWRGSCKGLSMQLKTAIQRSWREGGPKVVFTRSLKKLVRPAVTIGTLVFTECDLRKPMPERRVIPGFEVREATIEDVDLFEERDVFLQRLQAGRRCFIAIEEATRRLANRRWVNTSAAYIPELKRYFMLRPGEAYVYDLKTMPEFRRRGVDALNRHYTYSYLRDTGHIRIYAYIHGDNYPSLRASRHFLEPMGRIRYAQLRGCEPMMIGRLEGDFPEFSPLVVDLQDPSEIAAKA
jgi:hypothetical protein